MSVCISALKGHSWIIIIRQYFFELSNCCQKNATKVAKAKSKKKIDNNECVYFKKLNSILLLLHESDWLAP